MSCTYRLQKAIQRLEGVDKVKVQMEPTRAEVTPRAGAWLEAARLRGAIRDAGFKPGEVHYTVVGELTRWQGQPALRLSGGKQVILLQPLPSAPEVYERAGRALPEAEGRRAEVEGRLADPTDAKDREALAALCVQRVEIQAPLP